MTTTTRALGAYASDPVPSVESILRVYREATPEQIAEGVDWYSRTHTAARALDADNVQRAAGILAALSPQCPWSRNLDLANRVYAEGFASGTLGNSCRAADAIFNGADPLDVLRGPKVRAFFATILDPTDPHAVVIDRHAFAIAIGRTADDKDLKVLARKGGYERFAQAYRDAASVLGVAPSTVQAVTWVVWRQTRIRCAAAVRRGIYG